MVVLPLPVGPVTRMMPYGLMISDSNSARVSAGKPSDSRFDDDAGAVEDAQHDALAVQRRQGRDAQVDLLAHHPQLDAAVLRQAALGDVELGHDLDARDDRGLQPARRRLDVVEHAVDAVADLDLVLERLDVDVRCPLLDAPG